MCVQKFGIKYISNIGFNVEKSVNDGYKKDTKNDG
jgi:hypothetical protein